MYETAGTARECTREICRAHTHTSPLIYDGYIDGKRIPRARAAAAAAIQPARVREVVQGFIYMPGANLSFFCAQRRRSYTLPFVSFIRGTGTMCRPREIGYRVSEVYRKGRNIQRTRRTRALVAELNGY